jgi:hypothetical protein
MNVLDLDLYINVVRYIVCANYAGFVISDVLVILFFAKKNLKHMLIYVG